MNILIKKVFVVNPVSLHHSSKCDIYIEDGIYKNIAADINKEECAADMIVYNADGKMISGGWLDMRVNFREPGDELKGTIENGQLAALSGGFTAVALMPSTTPVIDNRTDIESVLSKSRGRLTDVFPCGAMTVNREGKEL